MAVSSWIKNFGQSVKFGTIDMAKELNPAVTSLYTSNEEFLSNLANTVRDIYKSQNRMSKLMERTGVGIDAKGMLKDTIFDLKTDIKKFIRTGKFNRAADMTGRMGKRAEAAMYGSIGMDMGDMSMDMNMDMNMEDMGSFDIGDDSMSFDDLPSPEELQKSADKGEALPSTQQITAEYGTAQISSIEKGNQINAIYGQKTVEGLSHVNNAITQQTSVLQSQLVKTTEMNYKQTLAMLQAQEAHFTKNEKTLEALNQNVANIVTFNQDTVLKWSMGAMKYYDDSLAELKKISAGMERLAPEKKEEEEHKSAFDRAGLKYGFNLSGYFDVVKENFLNSEFGGYLGMFPIQMLPSFGSNLFGNGMSWAMSKMVPKMLKQAMAEMNRSLENFFPAFFNKLATLAVDYNSNFILKNLGQIFGIQSSSGYFDTGKFEKGAVPWSGISDKTLNQVIPTYLSKIVALLSGGQERLFNYSTGKFETLQSMKERDKSDDENAQKRAFGDAYYDLRNLSNAIDFRSDKEENEFREYLDLFVKAVVTSGRFFDVNKANLMNLSSDLNNVTYNNLIMNTVRSLDRSKQIALGGASLKYQQQKYEDTQRKQKATDGDLSQYHMNNGWTNEDTIKDVENRNKRAAELGLPQGSIITPDSGKTEKKEYSDETRRGYGEDNSKIRSEDLSGKSPEELGKILSNYKAEKKKKREQAQKEGDKAANKGAGPEEITSGIRKFLEKASVYLKKPGQLLTDAVKSVDKTLYRILFGSKPGEDSLFKTFLKSSKEMFSKVSKWIKEELFSPIKRFLFGEDFRKSNFYLLFKGIFDKASNVFRGKKDATGKYSDGLMSSVFNEMGDASKSIRHFLTGKEYKRADGTTVASSKDNVFGHMSSAFKSIFSTFSKYMIGNAADQRDANGRKKPLIDVIINKIGRGLGALGSFITGSSNLDSDVIQKDYAKIIKEKAPKTIAYGVLGGVGLSLATPGLGIIGMFLPGGIIGSMILATGISALHQSDKFMNFLYGAKGSDGKRTGGIISAKVQEFFKKNKIGLAGGAIMGTITGLTGFSIPGMVLSMIGVGGIGLFPALVSSTIGPVLLSSAVGLAVKNESFHRFLFGSGNKEDGKKATGILNGEIAGKIKSKLPLFIGGGLLGFGAMAALSHFGILGALAINPYLSALMSGALGIGTASVKFKEALFGVYNVATGKFVKGGLVDVFKNAITMEILKPLSFFSEKTMLAVRKSVFNNIMIPMMRIVEPYKLFLEKIFTGIGSGVKSVFQTIMGKIQAVFSPITKILGKLLFGIFDFTRHAMSSVIRGSIGVAGGILGLPFRLLGIPAALITAHTMLFGKKEDKDRLKQAEENINQLKEEKNREFKELKEDIKQREKEFKEDKKQERKTGYEATAEQLAEKTAEYHSEVARIMEGNKEAATEQIKELITVNDNIKDSNSLLEHISVSLDTFLTGTSFKNKEELDNTIKEIRSKDEERAKIRQKEIEDLGEEYKPPTEEEKKAKEENDKNVINSIKDFITSNSIDHYTGGIAIEWGSNNKDTKNKDNNIVGRHPIGQRVVNKTGTYVLSEGEMVIPATQNPYNKKDISIQDAINAENNVIYEYLMENHKASIKAVNELIYSIKENTKAVKNINVNIEPKISANIKQSVESVIPKEAAGTTNSGLDIGEILQGKKKPAEGIADLNAGVGRDADKNVSSLLGRRTADVIVAERKEDKFRDDLLFAIRSIGKNFKDNAKEKTKSIFDSIKDLLGGLADLAKLFAFGSLIAALDKLSDKIQKFLDWFKGNGEGGPPLPDDYHDQRLVEDAAKIGGRAIYKGAQRALRARGTTLETEAAKLARTTKLIPTQLRARYGTGEEAVEHANQLRNKNVKLADDLKIIDDEIKARQSTASTIQEKAKIQELQETRQSIITEMEKNTNTAARVENRMATSIADRSYKDIGKEATEGIKNLEVSKIMDAVVDGFTKAVNSIRLSSPVRALLESDGVEKLCKSLDEVKKKITANKVAKMAGYISKKMATLMGKTAAIFGSGGTAIVVFGFIDGALGAYDAAELFHVNPEDVTTGMRSVAAVFNAFMGLPYIWFIDIGLEIAYLVTDGSVDVKAFLLKMIYDALPIEDKEDIEKLQQKSTNKFKEWKEKEENKNKDYGDYQKYKSSQYTPVANFIRENVPYGEYLSGKNDERGEFQHGILSAMGASYDQHSVINIPGIIADGTKKALLGGVDADGKFHKGILSDTDFGKSISDVLANIFGEEDTNDYQGRESIVTSFMNELNTEFDSTLAHIFGEKNVGEYQGQQGILQTFVEGARTDLNNTLAYVFGEMDVGKYQGQESLIRRFINTTRDDLNNTLAYIFGEMDVGDYKGKNGIIGKLISDFKASITDKATSFLNSLTYGFNSIIDKLFKNVTDINLSDIISAAFSKLFGDKAKTDNTTNVSTPIITPTVSSTTIGTPIIKTAGSGIDSISDELALDILQGKAGSGSLLTESQRNSNISNKPLVPSNPEYGNIKDLGCGIEALTDQFKKFNGGITSNDVRTKVSTRDVASQGQKGLTPYGLNNIANKSGFSMHPVNPSNTEAVKNVIRGKGLLGGVGPAINPIGRGAGHYVSSKGSFTKNGKEYAVLGDPMGNGLPRIANIDDVVKGVQAGGPNLAAVVGKGGSGFSSMLGGGLYGGSGIKSWLLKKITRVVLTDDEMDQLDAKLEGYPNLQLALKVIDHFDPISILQMPFDSMQRVDEGLRNGTIKPVDLNDIDSLAYSGSGLLSYIGGSGVENGDQLVQQSHEKYKGLPYVLGASDPTRELDCGFFTQNALKDAGYNLDNRCADFQYAEFKAKGAINSVEAGRAGDLIFFQNTYDPGPQDPPVVDNITHVGFVAGDGQISHSGNPNKIMPLEGGLQEKSYATGSIEKMFGIKPGKPGGLTSTNPNKITTDGAPHDGSTSNTTTTSSGTTSSNNSNNTSTSNTSSSSNDIGGLFGFGGKLSSIFKGFLEALILGKEYKGEEEKTTTNNTSSSNSSSTAAPSSTGNATTADSMDEKQIWDWFIAKGYSPEVTAGIMGRLKQETGNYSPKYERFQQANGYEVGGFGMFQWTYGDGHGYNYPDPMGSDKSTVYEKYPDSRLVKYMKWVDSKGGNYESAGNELEYLYDQDMKDHEYYATLSRQLSGYPSSSISINSWYPQDFNKITNPQDALLKWGSDYEIGIWEDAAKTYTDEIYNKYKGGSGLEFLNNRAGSGIENGDQLVQQSHEKYKGLPYVLGASDPTRELDCGFFTQNALKDAGYNLDNRCADFQYAEFKAKGAINSVENSHAGDLIFFQNTYDPGPQDPPVVDNITHVGFVAGDGQISHSGNPNKIMPLEGSSLQEKAYATGSIEKMFGIKPGKPGGLTSTNPNKITTDGAPAGSSPTTSTSSSSGTSGKSSSSSSGGLDGLSKFTNLLNSIFGKYTKALFSGTEYTGLTDAEWKSAIGGNTSSSSSSSSSSSRTSTSSNTTGDSLDEKQIYDWFKSKGYNDEATSGIMGRVKQEHNFNPKLSDKKIHYDPQYGGELGGMGIFQWTWDSAGENLPDSSLDINEYFKQGSQMHPDSRLAKYIKWCDEKGKPYESTASELDYFWEVDKDAQNYFADYYAGIPNWNPETLNQFDRSTVAQKWTAGFERGAPSENDTIYANEIYEKYAGKGGSGIDTTKPNMDIDDNLRYYTIYDMDIPEGMLKDNLIDPENDSIAVQTLKKKAQAEYIKQLENEEKKKKKKEKKKHRGLFGWLGGLLGADGLGNIFGNNEVGTDIFGNYNSGIKFNPKIMTQTIPDEKKYLYNTDKEKTFDNNDIQNQFKDKTEATSNIDIDKEKTFDIKKNNEIDSKITAIHQTMDEKINKLKLTGDSELINAIKSTDIHAEVQAIVQYLEMLVKGQKDMNVNMTNGYKETGPGITTGGGKKTGGIQNTENNPTVNVNVPVLKHNMQEIRDKHGAEYDYASIHSKNLEIARGGKFRDA